jgi:hypothetical protein
MKIAYLYERPVKEGQSMECELTLADWKGTRRAELSDLLATVREGDIVCVRAVGDLGQGRESKRIQKLIADAGARLEIIPGKDIRQRGRPARFKPDEAMRDRLCALWYSPAELPHVLARAEKITGQEIKRDQMYYICGPRDGSRKPK